MEHYVTIEVIIVAQIVASIDSNLPHQSLERFNGPMRGANSVFMP